MVEEGQHDGGGTFSNSLFLSLTNVLSISDLLYILAIVKQCISFNNLQHFRVSLSLLKALSGSKITLTNFYCYLINISLISLAYTTHLSLLHVFSAYPSF